MQWFRGEMLTNNQYDRLTDGWVKNMYPHNLTTLVGLQINNVIVTLILFNNLKIRVMTYLSGHKQFLCQVLASEFSS